MKLRITEKEYDEIERRVEIYAKEHTTCMYYPTDEDIEKIEENFPKYFEYILWITDYCVPQDEKEKECVKKLRRLCGDNLELYEKRTEIKHQILIENENLNINEDLFAEIEEEILE